jgi:hypothetical protein
MERVLSGSRALACAILTLCVWWPVGASAQTLGVGAHLAFVRGDSASPDTASAMYYGALVRARTSPHTALELTIDYRNKTDAAQTTKTRDVPIQASLLLYGPRTPLSFYLLGGVGWYNQRVEVLNSQLSTTATSTSKMGYHAGLGGELELGKHATLHVDYRYTLIHLGQNEGQAGAVPIPGTTDLQQKLKLSHEGSMWTMGVTVYF